MHNYDQSLVGRFFSVVLFFDGFRLFSWLEEGATIAAVRLYEADDEEANSPNNSSVAYYFLCRKHILQKHGVACYVEMFNNINGLDEASKGVWYVQH